MGPSMSFLPGEGRLVATDHFGEDAHVPLPGLVSTGRMDGGLFDNGENGSVTASILSWDFGRFLISFRAEVLPECTG